MKKFYMAVIALMMTISASAQFYLYCSDGNVIKVDSISMIAPGEPEKPDTPTEPEEPTNPSAGIGVFSVGEGKTVTFSKGNLQYTQSTNTWSFAENQWDMIGTDNVMGGSVSSDPKYGDSKEGTTLADKIDLFGWSTSATNFGVSTSTDWDNDYLGSFVDWGTNKIGYDAPNTWRTLSYYEWDYLLNTRTNASALKGVAQVNGVNGLVFLPDNWVCPSDITFKSGFHSSYDIDYYAAYQTFTADQWSTLEAAGAVFLPAAGYRFGTNVSAVQDGGYYWSATEFISKFAYYLRFYSDEAYLDDYYRNFGRSVRLVKDIEGGGATPDTPDTPDTPTEPVVVTYVLMGVAGDWTTGIALTQNPDNEKEYVLLGQAIAEGDVVKVVTLTNGTATAYCGNVEEGCPVERTADDMGNIVLAPGTYDFYYKTNAEVLWIDEGGVTPEPEPDPIEPYKSIGIFTVDEGKAISFAPGNLQYHPANNEWRFAENQTDYIGEANSNCSSTYDGWLDLFGWSTSTTYFGVSTSTDWRNGYSGSFIDWGTNKIGNDAPNTWRTLSYYEWKYLLNNRPNASSLCGVAQVNGVNGLVFLPDNWVCPSDITFKSGFYSSSGVDYYAAYQTFTVEQWSKLEAAGAVFLPASGIRGGSNVYRVQGDGHYWSATWHDGDDARYLIFYPDQAFMSNNYRYYGHSVRLVKDL